jgi:hypothetical protein
MSTGLREVAGALLVLFDHDFVLAFFMYFVRKKAWGASFARRAPEISLN